MTLPNYDMKKFENDSTFGNLGYCYDLSLTPVRVDSNLYQCLMFK